MSDYYGHMTLKDGSHVPLSKEDAEKLLQQADASQKAIAAKYPTEQDAINAISEATHRLKELGWNEPCYCPKDESVFSVIEAGSTGIHDCIYQGKWPDGSWYILAEGDVWPSHPMLFKPKPPTPDTAAPLPAPPAQHCEPKDPALQGSVAAGASQTPGPVSDALEPCQTCHGAGHWDNDTGGTDVCSDCNGTGRK